MVEKTPIERMRELAVQDYLTLTEVAEVASVGMNKAAKIRNELLIWMKRSDRYNYISSSRFLTTAVFEFLCIDISKYTGGYYHASN